MQVLDTGLIILTLKLTKIQPVLFDRSIDATNGCAFDEMEGPVTDASCIENCTEKKQSFHLL